MVNMSRIFELICISHNVLRLMKTSTSTTKKRNNFKIMDFLAQTNQLPELPQNYFIVQSVKSKYTIHNQCRLILCPFFWGWGLGFPLASARCDDYQTFIYTVKCEMTKVDWPKSTSYYFLLVLSTFVLHN